MAITAACILTIAPILGTIILHQADPNSNTTITGEINGLTTGLHGFHVHVFGNMSDGCKGAAGHFNPDGKLHGAPNDTERHAGDLGNIEADEELRAIIDMEDAEVKLYGDRTVLGRSFVIHEKEDDLGRGGAFDSNTTGNAGGRLACCIIGLTAETPVSAA